LPQLEGNEDNSTAGSIVVMWVSLSVFECLSEWFDDEEILSAFLGFLHFTSLLL